MVKRFVAASVVFALGGSGAPARASSDAAWAAFRGDVAHACLAAAKDRLDGAFAIVDPHGTPSYGVAIVYGRERLHAGFAAGMASLVCVYGKKSKTTEISDVVRTDFAAR